MNDAPDITELQETIAALAGALELAARYCEHPDVAAMPFALNSRVAAKRARRVIEQAEDVLRRANA